VGTQIGREYEIPPSDEREAMWLGKDAFCQIQIFDPQLSRRHCAFINENGRLFVEDMGSKNGTRANNQIVTEKVELNHDDIVTVGSHQLRAIFPATGPGTRTEGLAGLGKTEEEHEAYRKVLALSGTEFAGYRLGEIIFNGDTSVVFHAEDPKTGNAFAIKILKPLAELTIEDQNRFIRGAKHSAVLRHPNFVRVYKGGRVEGWYFIAMEYVEGTNLLERVEANGGPLELDEAVSIMRQVLGALQHAYERELVYRAVRPDNVLICEGLKVKLTDFDLVKPLSGRQEAQVTRVMDGSIRVAPEFAAPELIAYPVVADHKADVFGAGAVLYFMLTARAPFSKELPTGKLTGAFDRAFRSPDALNPAVPKALCDVIARAMSDYERYNTAGEMLEALEGALPK